MDGQEKAKALAAFRKSIAPTPVAGPRRYRLATLAGVRREVARLYRLADTGLLEWRDAGRGASILQTLAGLIRDSEVEARLAELEERIRKS